ncbi:cation transporter [Candidatus Bathyarchaeota archaeon]|nr:cation transporter [Candidatus Bathyarchaeota archaeon]
MQNKKDSTEEKVKDEKEDVKNRVIVSVTRMSCTICALAIEKQVKKLRGVSDVKAAIMLNKVFIDYNPNLVDLATIKKAIDKTGYTSYMAVEEQHEDKS